MEALAEEILEQREIRAELDHMCEEGRDHSQMIHFLLGYFAGQDSIPYELVEYAMDLRPELSII